jgi:hypothetical protein
MPHQSIVLYNLKQIEISEVVDKTPGEEVLFIPPRKAH